MKEGIYTLLQADQHDPFWSVNVVFNAILAKNNAIFCPRTEKLGRNDPLGGAFSFWVEWLLVILGTLFSSAVTREVTLSPCAQIYIAVSLVVSWRFDCFREITRRAELRAPQLSYPLGMHLPMSYHAPVASKIAQRIQHSAPGVTNALEGNATNVLQG